MEPLSDEAHENSEIVRRMVEILKEGRRQLEPYRLAREAAVAKIFLRGWRFARTGILTFGRRPRTDISLIARCLAKRFPLRCKKQEEREAEIEEDIRFYLRVRHDWSFV